MTPNDADILLCHCSECGEHDLCHGFGASTMATAGNSELVYVCESCLDRAIRKLRETEL